MIHVMSMRYWFNGPAREIGWMLIHSVWQGAVAALLLAGGLRIMDRRSSGARYLVCCAALLLTPAMSILMLSMLLPSNMPSRVNHSVSLMSPSSGVMAIMPALPEIHRFDLESCLEYAATAWVVGVALLALWHFSGWLNLLRWRRECRPIGEHWNDALGSLMKRMHLMRTIELLSSARLVTPAVMGIFKPVILIPIALAAELTAAQVDAILAHELAHIRRHDYLVNLIQTAIETLLFYHPAVWWISAQIRRERENCCDDVAAAMSDPIEYSSALLAAEALRQMPLAMGLNGHQLRSRVQRLIEPQPGARRRPVPSVLITVAIIVLLAACSVPLRRSFGQDAIAAKATEPTTNQNVLRVVVASDGILVDQKTTDWATVRQRLTAIDPAVRSKMRLELAAASAGVPIGKYLEAQGHASQIVHDLGLAYLSNTGIANESDVPGDIWWLHSQKLIITTHTERSAEGLISYRTEIRPVREGDHLELEVVQTKLKSVPVRWLPGNHLAVEVKATTAPADEKLVGTYYVGGHVNRPGDYSMGGRKITLMESITAAGLIDGDASDAHLDLIRRSEGGGEIILRGISVADLFDGKVADVFLMPYDVITVGTGTDRLTRP